MKGVSSLALLRGYGHSATVRRPGASVHASHRTEAFFARDRFPGFKYFPPCSSLAAGTFPCVQFKFGFSRRV